MSKELLDRLEGGYALMIQSAPSGDYVFVGSESKGGESKVIPLDGSGAVTVTRAVGGMMQILPVPGLKNHYVAAMGMYAPFIGQEAAIYLLRSGASPFDEWKVEKLFDMPFAHRVGFQQIGSDLHLFVASVSKHKDNPDDWSRPGGLYVVDFNRGMSDGKWDPKTISTGIFRNHGMWAGTLDGDEILLVSGAEGIFAVEAESSADASAETGFSLRLLIENEVSEMVAVDLDGDGLDEMVTIEPFHGNRLRVYKRKSAGAPWDSVWKTEDLSFAHGLNVVRYGDRVLVVVGSRREGKELLGYDFGDLTGEPRRIVIDEGVGPTQVEPISDGSDGVARFVSCNQGAGEVSRYKLTKQEILA